MAEQRGARHDPHAVHLRVDQRVEPEEPGEVRMIARDGLELLGPDELDRAGTDGDHVMVEMREQERVEVDELARDVQRADDALHPTDPMRAHRHARHHEARAVRGRSLRHDRLAVGVAGPFDRQVT